MNLPVLPRRTFLRISLSAAGGMLVGVRLSAASDRQLEAADSAERGQLGYFIRIETDNRIIIGSPQPEMGQGVKTSIPMLVAEELDADWSQVQVEQMPLGITRDQEGNVAWLHVGQGAGGSTSISDAWQPMREAGATARWQLVEAAAKRWSVASKRLRTDSGFVIDPATRRRLSYGELAAEASALPPPTATPALKSPEKYSIIGRPQNVVDAPDIVTGQARYGIDASLPGQVYAVIARCPWLDGGIVAMDDTAARKVPGVLDVVRLDGPARGEAYTILASGIAVVARNTWAAMQGRKALKIEWDRGPHSGESSASLRRAMAEAVQQQGQLVTDDGDVDEALARASATFSAEYFVPYASHASLEPQCCLVDVRKDGATVIGPIQMPSGASRMVNKLTGLDRLAIEVQMTRLGGGFGRRLAVDYVAEATMISMAVGKPVKLQWSREDDLQHDFYRPSGLQRLTAGTDDAGRIVAWRQRLASTSKYYRRPDMPDEKLWESEIYPDDPPRQLVPNVRLEYHSMFSGMPRGSWRAPAHYANAFAAQSFIDELARQAGQDPLAFQLQLLGEPRALDYTGHGGPVLDTGRLAGVLQLAADKAGWGTPLPEGHGRGIAGHFTFGGYAAFVVEVTARPGKFRVDRVVGAVDCGLAVNPNHVVAQMESGVHDGLSSALRLEITVDGGRVQQRNFDSYPLASIADAPRQLETYIVESPHPPSGMGEPPIPPLAPALANAIFDAVGLRIRDIPMLPHLQAAGFT